MVESGRKLVSAFEAGAPTDELKESAENLYAVCRPWV
jgi:hypothetical protein